MKKIILIILSFIFILSMTVTSLALPPPVRLELVATTVVSKDVVGDPITVTTTVYPDSCSFSPIESDFINSNQIHNTMSATYPELAFSDLKVVSVFNIDYTSTTEVIKKVTIAPHINGIVSKTRVGLFNYNGTTWDLLDTIVGTGTVTSSFNYDYYLGNPSRMVLALYESTLEKAPVSNVTVKNITGKNGNGENVYAEMTYGTPAELNAHFGTLSTPPGFPSSVINTQYPGVTNDNLKLLIAMDLSLVEEEGEPYFEAMGYQLLNGEQSIPPYTFSFSLADVSPKTKVFVLHGGEQWEIAKSEVIDGTVIAHFNHLSPVFIYAESDPITNEKEDPKPVITKEAEITKGPAPVMGDGMMNLVVFIMTIATIGMALVLRKE